MKNYQNYKMLILGALLLGMVFMLFGWLPGTGHSNHESGFIMGFVHGILAPVSLVIQVIFRRVRIYDTYNSGIAYDISYFVGIIAFLVIIFKFKFKLQIRR